MTGMLVQYTAWNPTTCSQVGQPWCQVNPTDCCGIGTPGSTIPGSTNPTGSSGLSCLNAANCISQCPHCCAGCCTPNQLILTASGFKSCSGANPPSPCEVMNGVYILTNTSTPGINETCSWNWARPSSDPYFGSNLVIQNISVFYDPGDVGRPPGWRMHYSTAFGNVQGPYKPTDSFQFFDSWQCGGPNVLTDTVGYKAGWSNAIGTCYCSSTTDHQGVGPAGKVTWTLIVPPPCGQGGSGGGSTGSSTSGGGSISTPCCPNGLPAQLSFTIPSNVPCLQGTYTLTNPFGNSNTWGLSTTVGGQPVTITAICSGSAWTANIVCGNTGFTTITSNTSSFSCTCPGTIATFSYGGGTFTNCCSFTAFNATLTCGGGSTPTTACCPNGLTTTLKAIIQAHAAYATCLNGTYNITWDSVNQWWQGQYNLCGHLVTIRFTCNGSGCTNMNVLILCDSNTIFTNNIQVCDCSTPYFYTSGQARATACATPSYNIGVTISS